MGALAAQKIDAYTKQNPNVNVPEILKQLKLQLNDPSIIKSIEDIKIKPDLRLIIQTKTFDEITGSEYMQDKLRSGILTFESYDEGMKKFKEGLIVFRHFLRRISYNNINMVSKDIL